EYWLKLWSSRVPTSVTTPILRLLVGPPLALPLPPVFPWHAARTTMAREAKVAPRAYRCFRMNSPSPSVCERNPRTPHANTAQSASTAEGLGRGESAASYCPPERASRENAAMLQRPPRRPRLVIFDLDGVVYRGLEPVPGAAELINHLHRRRVRVRYATNNSMATREAYV